MSSGRRESLPDLTFIISELTLDSALTNQNTLLRLTALNDRLSSLLTDVTEGNVVLTTTKKEISKNIDSISCIEERFSSQLDACIRNNEIRNHDLLYITRVGECIFKCLVLIYDIESEAFRIIEDNECEYSY